VPEPVALPDEADDRGARFAPEPAAVAAIPAAVAAKPAAFEPEPANIEPEPVAVAANPAAFEPEPAPSAAIPLAANPAAFEPEPAPSAAIPLEAEPAAFESEPAPPTAIPATTDAVDAAAAGPVGVVSPGDGRGPPPQRRLEQGQVVPLRPRATTRLRATGELLVLVAFLGLVVSGIIVALAVAGNQVLNGL
jgi:hypothetical protein